jgi:phenylacetate-CoA ligase
MQLYALRIERERYGRRFEQVLAELLRSERWSDSDLRAYQEERLCGLVRHAYECVPYYREVMDARRLQPSDMCRIEDLHKLPLLTREVVAERGNDLVARNLRPRHLYHGHTSGTTGSPLSFYWDRWTCTVTNAVDWRQKLWAGLGRDTWYAVALGRRVVSLDRTHPPFWQSNLVHKQLWLSAFHMSEAHLDSYFDEMERRGCQALEGYPSTCYVMARHLLKRGTTFPLRSVLTSSETLHPIQREAIESAFECPVFDFYGLAERVIFATECEHHEGHHLNQEYGITEVVDAEGQSVGPDTPGTLVGTSLHNHAMPFLRYRTTDITRVRSRACACGRGLPLIDDVATKAEDVVVTPDGRYLSPSALTHPFKPLHSIRQSQIVQRSVDEVEVRIVPDDEVAPHELEALRTGLQARLGQDVRIVISLVDEIPLSASGKYRWVISEVAKERPELALWESTPSSSR